MNFLGAEFDGGSAKSRANHECVLDPPFVVLMSVEVEDPVIVRASNASAYQKLASPEFARRANP